MDSDQLPYLETFTRAAELSSFTGAAHALGLTQAAVSQRVQALEKELGVSLFRRQGGRVLLTEAGRRFYPYAEKILLLQQEARAQATGLELPLRSALSLAASSIPGEHLLPALLSTFQQRHPHIQVRAFVADSLAVLRQVERGEVQLGMVGRKSESPHLDYRPFTTDTMVLIVPATHPWSRRKQITLKDLSGQPLIVRETGSGSRWCLEQSLLRSGRSLNDLRIALELGSNEAIKEAVLRGMGVAILSIQTMQKELQAGQLHSLTIRDLPLQREIFVAWDHRRVLPIPARLFLDLLPSCFVAGERP